MVTQYLSQMIRVCVPSVKVNGRHNHLETMVNSEPTSNCQHHLWLSVHNCHNTFQQGWAYLMMVILNVPDDGYSERTWWRLFQKLVVRTKLDIYLFIIERKLKQLWLTILSTKRTIISHLNSLIIIKNYGIKIGHPGSDLVQAQKCGEVKPVNVLLSFEKKIWKANLDDVF
jgi:hypothetical protein